MKSTIYKSNQVFDVQHLPGGVMKALISPVGHEMFFDVRKKDGEFNLDHGRIVFFDSISNARAASAKVLKNMPPR